MQWPEGITVQLFKEKASPMKVDPSKAAIKPLVKAIFEKWEDDDCYDDGNVDKRLPSTSGVTIYLLFSGTDAIGICVMAYPRTWWTNN